MGATAVIEQLSPLTARTEDGTRRLRFLLQSDVAVQIGDRVVVDFVDEARTSAQLVEVLPPLEALPPVPPPPKAPYFDPATEGLMRGAARRVPMSDTARLAATNRVLTVLRSEQAGTAAHAEALRELVRLARMGARL